MIDKIREVVKKYYFCKSMIYAIQAITKEKTHDILNTLALEAENIIKNQKLNIVEKLEIGWCKDKKTRGYIYYPNTKLYLGIYIYLSANKKVLNDKYCIYNELSYTYKLPQSFIKMNEKRFNEIVIDGLLTDSSFDFPKPKIILKKT